jgi:hypothetical protein
LTGRDDDRGDRVALDELGGTVHRAVEVGLGGDLLAAPSRLVLVDEAGVEVGVDGHLLAGHRVEGESGGDLGDAAGAVGDDDELDDHQDDEDDQADDERAADDEVAERVDDLTGGSRRGARVGWRTGSSRAGRASRCSSSDGKTAKSSGLVTARLTSMMRIENVMLNASSMSSSSAGMGTTIITTMPMMTPGTPICATRFDFT